MIAIYTTVSQHPKGLDLHVRNLKWAFSNFEHRIVVQTFEHHGFRDCDGVEIMSYRANPGEYFRFHDHLEPSADNVVVFVQQDNIFARKVDPVVGLCRSGAVLSWDQNDYYSVYDRHLNKVYPRIGEISTFLPGRAIEEFRHFNLSFGSDGRAFHPEGHLFTRFSSLLEKHIINAFPWEPPRARFMKLSELCARDRKEVLFDVFVYCFCTGKPVRLLGPNWVLHFQNPERFHRERPETYRAAEHLLDIRDETGPRFGRYIPSVALMFLLSGVYEPADAVSWALGLGGREFRMMLRLLAQNAGEWMSDAQADRLRWAISEVGASR